MSSPIEQFEGLRKNAKLIFLVFYRGHWCPFCLNYLKSFALIAATIRGARGQPVIATAEQSHESLAVVREKTGFKDMAIVDPENVLAAHLKKQGLVDVAITQKSGYPHGMAQPAVLVLGKDWASNEKVYYQWAIKPSLRNMGGAKDRPSLVQIWDDVDAEMKGKDSVHRGMYSKQSFFQGLGTKLFG